MNKASLLSKVVATGTGGSYVGYDQAVRILQKLEENGYEAFFVGGCVRDWLLGRSVHDIDICTNAHPGDVISLFPDHVPTGLKHGTVSVKQGGFLFEVTTYRTEGKYEDYRRPSTVQFVSDLRLDLERRDFTINAMAMDRHQNLQDPFAGREDLSRKLIRAVGNPAERFQEDALRLLRAVRFAAQLDFSIETRTMAAMKQTAPLLDRIAVERVREELNKMLKSQSPEKGCEWLCEAKLFAYSPLLEQLFEQSKKHTWRLRHLSSLPQKWTLLLFAARLSTDAVKAVCEILRFSKRDSERIELLVDWLYRVQPQWDAPHEVEWKSILLETGKEIAQELNSLLLACWWNQKERFAQDAVHSVYEALPVKTTKELAVTGRDLYVVLGKKQGEWIGRVLVSLLKQTAYDGLPNTPEALIAAAKKEVALDED
ncbi:CCA tRNA nucleotidyltransferase [Brevibacillus invocatus]|uniref:CCA tRNA nucleotidyltransferase n=1 Tax=Brevibacillus invocatus TaxID=173959 RepID=A0A3M8CIX8_9BACL|nr:CCA tRNA nucleotidyltransferase [Brevibacillus invocatus]RNB75317.1 CCA tRNA nucleotidyltransferase [Brevibacillus invocatus]CFJ31702.1 tRNA adenylyltransferase [Mycobacterium tuberculosis]